MRLYFDWLTRWTKNVLSPARTLDDILAERRHTSPNTGNLVHLEAMPKLLRCDRGAILPARGADDGDLREFREEIDASFDGVVLQYSNTIRSHDNKKPAEREITLGNFRATAQWLSKTTCKIFAFGMGLQDKLEPSPDAVPPELFELLTVLNDRAELFAVRGKATEAWLHSVGITRAVALGCPSLFVYPMNTSRITAPSIDRNTRVATAGRLQRGKSEERLRAIAKIGHTFPACYVFQNDFYPLFRNQTDLPVYNDATGRVDGKWVQALVKKRFDVELAFEKYYLFRTVEMWRGFTESVDLFFGDRFHGGVVFLQCGRPAVVIRNDERVSELVDFFGIPSIKTADLLEGDPLTLLRSALSDENMARFRATYLQRADAFRNALKKAGLELANDDAFTEALGGSQQRRAS